MSEPREGPLSGYRILEFADVRTALGCRQLADLGAEVIRIEPPDGAPVGQGGGAKTLPDSGAPAPLRSVGLWPSRVVETCRER